jgi:2-methylcitrate dehydratase PrpD
MNERSDMTEAMMDKDDDGGSLDRRMFLGASTATLLGLPGISLAQEQKPGGPGKGGDPAARAPSQAIADFVTGFDLKDAPPIVIERSRIAFVDTVGVILAGSRLPPADIVCDIIKLEGSAPVATIVGRPLRTSPQLAALANGVAGHAMDFDLNTAGQSVAGVIPAILPVAETTGATPAEMLAAFIVAAEVAARLFRAAPQGWRKTSWHGTGTIGTTAAAIASARLMKVRAEKIPDIVGITVSMAGSLNVNFGTMTKPLHSGRAAQQGVLAAMLGARGFTASQSALEGRGGYFESFVQKWTLEPFADLGRRYDLAETGYRLKPYPSGGLGHAAIDAALELRELIKLDDIAHVDVAISNYAARRITDKYPRTEESAKFSAPYLAAYTLVHGAPMLAAFTEEALHDEVVRSLARKVSVATYAEYADVLEDSPAKVTVTLNDGRKIERSNYYPSGSMQVPMSPAQIKAKFDICAAQAIDNSAAETIYLMLSTIGEQPSFAEFWPLLRKE